MSVYLDHNASTPLDPRVLEAMQPYLGGPYANPSSQHRYGRAARDAVETARAQVAALAGAMASEVVFTSGGTEANNFAIKGAAAGRAGSRLLYSAIEHPCVTEPMAALQARGWATEALAVDGDGRVDRAAFQGQLAGGGVRLVSCMAANNETGVLQDIAALAADAQAAGALMHVDAVQAAGKIELDFAGSGVQLMSLSSHKIYGPKGAGALLVDAGIELEPLLHGGGQEQGRRGGTENVAAIVGFGAAAELARQERVERMKFAGGLRDRLEASLREIEGLRIFSAAAPRLRNTSQFAIPGVHSATLLGLLDKRGFAVSSGSACASGTDEPSPVLLALGVPAPLALCAVRVSVGRGNSTAEVDGFVAALREILAGFKSSMPAVVAST